MPRVVSKCFRHRSTLRGLRIGIASMFNFPRGNGHLLYEPWMAVAPASVPSASVNRILDSFPGIIHDDELFPVRTSLMEAGFALP